MISIPETATTAQRTSPVRAALVVFFTALLVIGISINRKLNLYDEGIILTGATRVAEGAVLHRDFYVNYGPAQFYVVALLFKLCGPSVLIARLWDILVRAAVVVCAFLIGRRLTTLKWSVIGTVLCVVWLSYIGVPGWPVWPALLIVMLQAPLLFHVFEREPSVARLFTAGICIGLATLFRYDIGFLICACESAVLFAYCLGRNIGFRARLRRCAIVALSLWGGIALICAPVAFVYVLLGAAGDFWFDIVQFPTRFYALMRGLPFPSRLFSGLSVNPIEYIVYLPLAAASALIAALFCTDYFVGANSRDARSAGVHSEGLRWKLALLAAIMIAFYTKAYVRLGAGSVGLALIPCFIVLAVVVSAYPNRRPPVVALALGVCAIFGVLPTLRAAQLVAVNAAANITWAVRSIRTGESPVGYAAANGSCRPEPGLERIACFVLTPDQTQTVQYLQARIPAGGPVFFGLSRHDKVYANDVGLYFVSKLRPVTKWYHFDPGLQTSATTQNLMIMDLERGKPAYVVLNAQWEPMAEPNGSALSSGVLLLDRWIDGHYKRVASFGTYSILARTDN